MPKSKGRCCICKKGFKKDDKVFLIGLKKYCGVIACRDELIDKVSKQEAQRAKKKREREEREANAAIKKAFYDNDLKTRKAAAKKACHDYIRARDAGSFCICCGNPLDEEYHAGHFWESGNYPRIRYDEDNIHAQSVQCNFFKGGDSGGYRENLTVKIGKERIERLDRIKHLKVKFTADLYKAIEDYYKQKLRDLNNGIDNDTRDSFNRLFDQ